MNKLRKDKQLHMRIASPEFHAAQIVARERGYRSLSKFIRDLLAKQTKQVMKQLSQAGD